MRSGSRRAGIASLKRGVEGCKGQSLARRAVGVVAILWIAAGALALQRPIYNVQTEARMIQMAGEAVARVTERKKQESEKPGPKIESRVGTKARRGVVRIVVSIPDRRLALIEDDRVVRIYPVAVGAAATPSPEGEFRIASRLENPSWYWPGKVIPAGSANPLGPRYLGLGLPAGAAYRGFAIHGTNEPQSIGRSASHGCIRLANRDAKDLFRRVRVGDRVEIRGKRDAMLAMIFGAPQDDSATLRTASAGSTLDAKFVIAGESRTVRE
jgi:lipoprotein-anchoring transpeptidase ErfK/SrfK